MSGRNRTATALLVGSASASSEPLPEPWAAIYLDDLAPARRSRLPRVADVALGGSPSRDPSTPEAFKDRVVAAFCAPVEGARQGTTIQELIRTAAEPVAVLGLDEGAK